MMTGWVVHSHFGTWPSKLFLIFSFVNLVQGVAHNIWSLVGSWLVVGVFEITPNLGCAARVSGAPVKSLQHINHFITKSGNRGGTAEKQSSLGRQTGKT